jgi:hypothetical protein
LAFAFQTFYFRENFMSDFPQTTVVVGSQWGDEGKGKIVDVLAEKYNVVYYHLVIALIALFL